MTETPSHHDIIARVRDLDMAFETHKGEAAAFWAEARQSNRDIAHALSVIGTQVDRIEEKVLGYDRLRDRVATAVTVAAMFIAVIWWMTKDAWARVFGVTP